jgi:hypothetical protein
MERIGQLVKLTLPGSKGGYPAVREYALTRKQVTDLIAEAIDTLDAMDLDAASAEVISMVKAAG